MIEIEIPSWAMQVNQGFPRYLMLNVQTITFRMIAMKALNLGAGKLIAMKSLQEGALEDKELSSVDALQ